MTNNKNQPTLDDVREVMFELLSIPGMSITGKRIVRSTKGSPTSLSDVKPKQYKKIIKKCNKAYNRHMTGGK